jgi:hypothetical protein
MAKATTKLNAFCRIEEQARAVCTENLIRIDCATESPKRQWR